MYMSRALTETEQRYSNIERELLAIVFVLERLNHDTFGRTITVQSDHQPQQSTNSKVKESNIDIIPIHHITQSVPVSKTRLQELRLATQSDPRLHSLIKTVHEGWPQYRKDCPEQLLGFWSLRQDISEEDRLLYKNQRLIVPHSERL